MPTFYRIIRDSEPSLEDFMSPRSLGRRLKDPLHEREWGEGIFVFDDFDRACVIARRWAFRQGSYIVALLVPEGSDIEFRQTFSDDHHFTIYEDPHVIMALGSEPMVRIPGAPGE